MNQKELHMRISAQQLKAFQATARFVSITKAAKALHVTQPTVSIQLKELAHIIGEPLFEPLGRGISLTQAGELLLETLEEVASCWQGFEAKLAQMHGLLGGRLKIAAVTTAEYFVPDLIGPFAQAHPGVDIELAIENRDRVVARLQNGTDDIVVMMMPPKDMELVQMPFLDNPLVVVAPSAHPLNQTKKRRSIPLSRLADERWLMREQGSGTRMAAEQHFLKAGFAPRIAMSLGSNEALKHAVAAGLGLSVISMLAITSIAQNTKLSINTDVNGPLCILPVAGFPIQRVWYACWRKDRALTEAAKQFIEYLGQNTNKNAK